MSLFPAYFGARKPADDDSAPAPEPANESRDDIFNLIPPRAANKYERPTVAEKPQAAEAAETIEGRNVHPATAMDLTRLSIDNDGRLYWDGKPVEVRRQLMMSRNQVIGASLLAFFIVVGAIGSAIQATVSLQDWACRSGWASHCGSPGTAPAPRPSSPRLDIPA